MWCSEKLLCYMTGFFSLNKCNIVMEGDDDRRQKEIFGLFKVSHS